MGVGGLQPLPVGYLRRMYELVRKHGGLTICDEVQTGFGRIGKDYWGFKANGVQPDIVTMAKGIGNGIPMAAVACRKEIMDSIKKVHFNTFGGGLLQSRVGMEVLNIIKDEKLNENAENVGGYLKKRLLEVAEKSRVLGDVRGRGLMLGVEIVKDKKTKEPGTEISAEINEATKDCGILVSKGGIFGNIFRMIPPLCLTKEDADYVANVWEHVLKKYN
jgi:alanine-glyoxylate transaminase/(R)-3-amino-2-methylpropionate-pyruvate transaminase